MNKKGFTLLELLAVVVILAVIVIISVPKMLKIVEGSKKNNFVSSTKIIDKAVKQDSVISGSTVYTLANGKLMNSNNEEVPIKGKISSTAMAVIQFSDGKVKIISGQICDGENKYCINISNDLSKVSVNNIESVEETTILSEGNVGRTEAGNVTYKLYSNGKVVLDGTGDGLMKDFDPNNPSAWQKYIIDQIIVPINNNLALGVDPNSNETKENISALFGIIYDSGKSKTSDLIDYVINELGTDPNEAPTLVNELLNSLFGSNGATVFDNINIKPVYIGFIQINSGVTSIGQYAFDNMKSYTVSIPNTVTQIFHFAFRGNKITILTIPASVDKIWYNAFDNNQITQITIEGADPNRFNSDWENIGFPLNLKY